MDKKKLSQALLAQKGEITGYILYLNFSKKSKESNKKILEHIAKDELEHYNYWKSITKVDVKPDRFRVFIYTLITNLLGFAFGLKLMERGELLSYNNYKKLKGKFPEVRKIIKDEERHENELISLLSDKRLEYAGSIVLGLNDALVELTGALVGLTLALQNNVFVAIVGLVTGIAAALSMAASSYLSSREDAEQNKKPITSALYTGITYIVTVILLILPYFIFENIYTSLIVMLGIGILIVSGYTFYISTAKDLSFWRRFGGMILISFSVAAISFGIGLLVRSVFGLEV